VIFCRINLTLPELYEIDNLQLHVTFPTYVLFTAMKITVAALQKDFIEGSLAYSYYSSWVAFADPLSPNILLGNASKVFKATWNLRDSFLGQGKERISSYLSFYGLNTITEAPTVNQNDYYTDNTRFFYLQIDIQFDDFYILQVEQKSIEGVDAIIVIGLSIIGLYHLAHFVAEVGIYLKDSLQKRKENKICKCFSNFCSCKSNHITNEELQRDMQELLAEQDNEDEDDVV